MSAGIRFKTRVMAGVKNLIRNWLSRKSVAIFDDSSRLAMSLLAVSSWWTFS